MSSYAHAAPRQAPGNHSTHDDEPERYASATAGAFRRFVQNHAGLKVGDVVERFNVAEGDKVLLLTRVSSHQQAKRRNLQGQEGWLRFRVEVAGGVVVGVEEREWSGRDPLWIEELSKIRDRALSLGATVLLAACADRIIRHPEFVSTDPDRWQLQAVGSQWRDVKTATKGIRLMTLLRPDASPGACRSLLTSWGRGAKMAQDRTRTRSGFRSSVLPRVKFLRSQGHSYRDVAGIITRESGRRVTHTAIRNWLLDGVETFGAGS